MQNSKNFDIYINQLIIIESTINAKKKSLNRFATLQKNE